MFICHLWLFLWLRLWLAIHIRFIFCKTRESMIKAAIEIDILFKFFFFWSRLLSFFPFLWQLLCVGIVPFLGLRLRIVYHLTSEDISFPRSCLCWDFNFLTKLFGLKWVVFFLSVPVKSWLLLQLIISFLKAYSLYWKLKIITKRSNNASNSFKFKLMHEFALRSIWIIKTHQKTYILSSNWQAPLIISFFLLVSLLVNNSTVYSVPSILNLQMYCSLVDLIVFPTSLIS